MLPQLSPWSQLVDHTFDLCKLRSCCLVSKQFESIHILGLQRLLASLIDQPTFHPHFDAFLWFEVGALGDKR